MSAHPRRGARRQVVVVAASNASTQVRSVTRRSDRRLCSARDSESYTANEGVMMDTEDRHDVDRSVELINWDGVATGAISGMVIGLGLFASLTGFGVALALGVADGWMSDNLRWFVRGSAALALVVSGMVAAALTGVRGMIAGSARGMAACGLLVALSLSALTVGASNLALGLGTTFDILTMTAVASVDAGGGLSGGMALWTGFWSMLVAVASSALGGVVLAATRRPADLPGQRDMRIPPLHGC